jgi:hypothetical protein
MTQAAGRRTSTRELRLLVERLWPHSCDHGNPVRVTMGSLPAGYDVQEEYFVLASRLAPTMLVPSAAPAKALAMYTATQPYWVQQAARATGVALSADRAHLLPRLRVGATADRYGNGDSDGSRLLRVLEQELGARHLLACIPVRRERPGTKPIMLVFHRGEKIAPSWVKVGWSTSTRELVAREHTTLRAIHDRMTCLAVPRPIASGSWHGLNYSVTAAIEGRARRWSSPPETTPEVFHELCRTGRVSDQTLASSPYARRLERTLDKTSRSEPEVTRALGRLLERLRADETVLRFGRSHGDWVPWNLGRSGTSLNAWDWEYSYCDVPLGFDVLHWHFQTTLANQARSLGHSIDAVDAAAEGLGILGLPMESRRTVASAYILDIFVRSLRQAASDGAWNPRIRTDIIKVSDQRQPR